MRGPENMASDSEPKKFFFEAPRAPSEVTFREVIKPVRLLMSNDSAGVEVGHQH